MKQVWDKFSGLFAALFLVTVLLSSSAFAQGPQTHVDELFAGISQPQIPQAKGDVCIAPTEFMRRNHMNMLTHDRDKTVKFGDREIKASLKDCVACHAVKGADGRAITSDDPKFFCRTCHDYVAVKIGCFECHASRPGIVLKGKLDAQSPETLALAAYVNSAKKGSEE